MRIVSCGMAIALASLSLAGGALAAPVETVLYRFLGGSDGSFPYAGLIADEKGALYGTTLGGGSGCPQNPNGCGTVFRLTPPTKGQSAWAETVLYSFKGGSDGQGPSAGLIIDKQGALYGTTALGGNDCPHQVSSNGFGTVFKLTPPAKGQTAWTPTVLYRFFCSQPSCSEGVNPYAGLIADREGALYGTTLSGGSGDNGTVFKLAPPAKGQTAWTETVLYRFSGGSDGADPFAGLIADNQGTLYGTTIGGAGSCFTGSGCGTVFKLNLCPEPKWNDWRENDKDHDHDGCPIFVSEE